MEASRSLVVQGAAEPSRRRVEEAAALVAVLAQVAQARTVVKAATQALRWGLVPTPAMEGSAVLAPSPQAWSWGLRAPMARLGRKTTPATVVAGVGLEPVSALWAARAEMAELQVVGEAEALPLAM